MNDDRRDIEDVVQRYLDALHENDPAKIAQVFHQCCHLFSVTDGKLNDLSRDRWLELMAARPSPKAQGLERRDWITTVDQSGPSTAFAKVQCQVPPRYFVDYLILAKLADGWRIVSKAFHLDTRE